MPKPIKRRRWSYIDVFGLLNGFSTWDDQYKNLKYVRKPYDTGLDVKDRIFRNHDNKGDTTKQGIINGICNEFEETPYNVISKSNFELTYEPSPRGAKYVQDIWAYFKNSDGDWENLGPQVWSNNYEKAKDDERGFIVWQNERYSNIPGHKNYTYSNLVKIFRKLPDKTELKFKYYIPIMNEGEVEYHLYTDMNSQTDNNDDRYTYRCAEENPSTSGILVYTLGEIPENIKDTVYYDSNNKPTQFSYDIKEYIDKKYNHKWGVITNRSCIWDIHKTYGKGHLPSYYDATAPRNLDCRTNYSGYIGGIDSCSYSLYNDEVVQSGDYWYLRLYPGKFYVNDKLYYYFEDYQKTYLNFTSSSGLYESDIPSGLQMGMHTIVAKSGYYESYCNDEQDEYLPNVFEDYSYFNGVDGNNYWCDIYRRQPNLTTQMGKDESLNMGSYKIDFDNNKIYANLPSGYEEAVMIWDNTIIPSGTLLEYDINPINERQLSFDKFFLYLTNE